ncbi:2-oxoglutarate dehydrogenase E1 component [Buchnera aphidicola (Eriosoma lanigerum)]|uniref:2-oxoglutarate dehydrogenase E1 component n=1 Tax=Buchnera aphidicola TaxID=9 RepID=UPI0034642F89
MIRNEIDHSVDFSFLTGNNIIYLEYLYFNFLENKNLVHNSWHNFFFTVSMNHKKQYSLLNLRKEKICIEDEKSNNTLSNNNYNYDLLFDKISSLIYAFRSYGYQYSDIDPLKLQKINIRTDLELSTYNFSEIDLHRELINKQYITSYVTSNIYNLYKKLVDIYCQSIGFEYMHINDDKEKIWLQKHIESKDLIFCLTANEKKHILKKLIQAESLEQFLAKTFPSTKRFSLEGAETLIPILDEICQSTKNNQINKIVFGMAHRGRLNVLVNILGKKYEDLFYEFQYNYYDLHKSGDVKYHAGYNSKMNIHVNKTIELSLQCNPSHLETIHPVVMGTVRADLYNNKSNNYNTIIPIAIHGDASISGQGIIQETLNMSQTQAYTVGGTIHIIINNQIGFTTSNKYELRSSHYCSEIGKMIQSPIFHVNTDDPEAAIFAIRLAVNFRLKFNRDVFINLVCYRRNGHNEVDDPSITQPVMYNKIKSHKTITDLFFKKLIKLKIIHNNDKEILNNTFQTKLQLAYEKSLKKAIVHENKEFTKKNILIYNDSINKSNYIQLKYLKKLAIQINQLPSNINCHKKIKKIYQDRIDMAIGNKLFDWGASEILAYATILNQKISCRISGEDTCRGTFFHRHAIIYDQINNSTYIPLQNINSNQGVFNIYNSVLSEESTLAFEYGFSTNVRNTLTIWEAQFGDFSNVAQVIIDQFISSGEQKWGLYCNLVLFLPHGYEGQGPEHSSARIERFLQLCAEDNIQVCIPSTSGQMYHLIRRQAFQIVKKPLIIFTPKSLLRYQYSCSPIQVLVNGKFEKVICEQEIEKNKTIIQRIIVCSGKIYFDLCEQRKTNKQNNILILRIEQLYPFPIDEFTKIIKLYNNIKDFVWCQEEPRNQGAWQFIKNYLHEIISKNATIRYVGRPESAATATGYIYIHRKQQKKLIDDALNIKTIEEQ